MKIYNNGIRKYIENNENNENNKNSNTLLQILTTSFNSNSNMRYFGRDKYIGQILILGVSNYNLLQFELLEYGSSIHISDNKEISSIKYIEIDKYNLIKGILKWKQSPDHSIYIVNIKVNYLSVSITQQIIITHNHFNENDRYNIINDKNIYIKDISGKKYIWK